MFKTTYHNTKPIGMDEVALMAFGEAERARYTSEHPTLEALRHWGIHTLPREPSTNRDPLLLRIDGQVDGRTSGIYFTGSIANRYRAYIEQAITLGRVLLHYYPHVESGYFTDSDGLMVSCNSHSADEHACNREALQFASGFLMPESLVRDALKANTLDTTFPYPKIFLSIRLRGLGLST